jgi:hypothetical protein
MMYRIPFSNPSLIILMRGRAVMLGLLGGLVLYAAFRAGRSERTALDRSSPLGWAEIRHPFHPLRGRCFEVLKKRRTAGVDTLILRELERGSFSVAREWTDWADPSLSDSLGLPPRRLDAQSLLELISLLEALTKPKQKG